VEYLLTLGKREVDLASDEKGRFLEYRAQEELACRGADAVLCVSRPMAKLVAERYGIDAAKLGRVPNHAAPVPDAEARGPLRARTSASQARRSSSPTPARWRRGSCPTRR